MSMPLQSRLKNHGLWVQYMAIDIFHYLHIVCKQNKEGQLDLLDTRLKIPTISEIFSSQLKDKQ